MQRILLDGKEVFYEIRPSRRARRLGLTVYPGGHLVLTLPPHTERARAESFMRSHEKWIEKSLRRFAHKKKLPGGVKEYRLHKEAARTMIQQKISHYNTYFGFRVGKISIRNTRSRWGSCSHNGNLSFSYKVIYLPQELVDYIVVHELAHLKHFDHSPAFWATVAQFIPDYKSLRRELRSFVH